MSVYFYFLAISFFFTTIAIIKPHYFWGILATISWWLSFWYTRANPIVGFTIGDFGDTILIAITLGVSIFILTFTVFRVRREKETEARELMERTGEGREIGARESSDDYYNRLNRVLYPKKK